MNFDFKKLTEGEMLLIIGLIIIVIPPLLVQPIFSIMDFTESGQIGDTIGGITAPFINGLAAILVFIAFKEQVRANSILKGQINYDKINGQIDRIIDNKVDLNDYLKQLKKFHSHISTGDSYAVHDYRNLLNKILYYTTDFKLCLELLEGDENNEKDKELLWKRLYYIYVILYKDSFNDIYTELQDFAKKPNLDAKLNLYIADILFEIEKLNKQIKDVDK